MSMDQESLSTEEQTERAEARELMVPMTPAELGLITTAICYEIGGHKDFINRTKEFRESKDITEITAEYSDMLTNLEALNTKLMRFAFRLDLPEFQEYLAHL